MGYLGTHYIILQGLQGLQRLQVSPFLFLGPSFPFLALIEC